MNTMKPITLVLISFLSAYVTPSHGQAYKCSVGNKTVFSDSPCSGDVRKPHESGHADTSSSQAGDPKENGAKNCKNDMLKSIAWKDPESIRVGRISGGAMEVIDFANTKIGARRYDVNVNAKNSYGSYIGEKPITCFTSQDGMRVLKLDSALFDAEKTR